MYYTKKKRILPLALAVLIASMLMFTGCNSFVEGFNEGYNGTTETEKSTTPSPSTSQPVQESPSPAIPTDVALVADSYPGEILYIGSPIMNWMGARLADLREVFGAPDVEGIVGEGGAYGFSYEDITFIKNTQGEDITYIEGLPSSLSVNGITLDTSRDQLVSLLGNPVYEDWGDEEYYAMLGMDNSYYMTFSQDTYSISFELDDPSGKAWSFTIFYSDGGSEDDDGWYEEDYYDYQTPEIDANLLGRWRSDDGRSLELRENGSFSIPWSLAMPALCNLDLNNSYWEANNGRITISYHYNHHPRLDGFEIDSNSGVELMTLGLAIYYRCDTTQNGTGLVGEWGRAADRKRNPEPILVFRENYTGSTTDKEFTWMMSDGSPLMTYAATSSVDYKVYGDLLTIYFTDGSQVFTRVGN